MKSAIHINIGTEKYSFWVPLSKYLLKQLEKFPFLFDAIEEASLCAKNEYYTAGILTFSQLLNIFNKGTPSARHDVAHEILVKRPSKKIYKEIVRNFKNAAIEKHQEETKKSGNIQIYEKGLQRLWQALINKFKEEDWKNTS